MTFPAISTAPPAPQATDTPAVFSALAFAFAAHIEGQSAEYNALSAAYAAWITSAHTGTSASSMTIGTGAQSCATQAGLAFSPGQPVMAARTSDAGSSRMMGIITSYDSGTGALGFTVPSGAATGSGTFTDWSIGLMPATDAATLAGAEMLENKRFRPRVSATTSFGTALTPAPETYDMYVSTAQADDCTVNAPAGTYYDGEKIIIRAVDDTTSRTFTFDGDAAGGFSDCSGLMATSGNDWTYATTSGKKIIFGCIYDAAADVWDIVAVSEEA